MRDGERYDGRRFKRVGSFLVLGWLASCSAGQAETETPDTVDAPPSEPEAAPPPSGTFVDRSAALASASSRADTIRQLKQDYAQAAKNGTNTEEAKSFIAHYAEPLAQAYVDGHDSLDEKLRLDLLTMLVSFKDKRTFPAHDKALRVYAETQTGTEEAIRASLAAKQLPDERFAAPLLLAFDAVDMADDDRHRLGRHVFEAMESNPSSTYRARLMARLKAPLERPETFNDKPAVKKFQNQLYWQSSAAKLLGAVGDAASARLLAEILLEPNKRDLHPHAELSLVQLSRPALELAHGLLSGSDAELVAAAKKAHPEASGAAAYYATEWLIRLRHPSSRGELLRAFAAQRDPQSKVLIARALTYFPSSEESLAAFKTAYASSSLKLTLPAGESALEALVEHSPYFFEPKLADWLMSLPGKVRGGGPRHGDVQRALVVAVGQLVTQTQLKDANRVAQQYGGRSGTPAYERSEALTRKCAEHASCYLEALRGLDGPDDADLQVADKALTMIGVFGGSAERDALVPLLGSVQDPRLTEVIARVVAHLSQKADAKLVQKVEATLAARGNPAEPRAAAAARPAQLLLYQLEARQGG